MKVKEFGAWPSRNISTGGRRSSFDEYNRASKGSERAPTAEEFASRNIKDYHHYAEQQDLTKEQDDQQEKKRQKEKDARSRRMRMVQQVAVLAVGSVMIATSYNAMVAKREALQAAEPNDAVVDTVPDDSGNNGDNTGDNGITPDDSAATPDEAATQPTESATQPATTAPTQGGNSLPAQNNQSSQNNQNSSNAQNTTETTSEGYTVSWKWSEDYKTVSLVITDSTGKVISETEAEVTSSQSAATCKSDGKITYTASAAYNGQTYTDTRSETIPALGHSFDSGTEITLSDGSTAMDFECTRCHEHFVIKNSVTEE